MKFFTVKCEIWKSRFTRLLIRNRNEKYSIQTLVFRKSVDRIQINVDYSKTRTINRKIIRYFIKELFCVMKSYTIIYISYTCLNIDIRSVQKY